MAIRLAPLLALRVYEMPVELAPIPLALICTAGMTRTLCRWFRQHQLAKSLG